MAKRKPSRSKADSEPVAHVSTDSHDANNSKSDVSNIGNVSNNSPLISKRPRGRPRVLKEVMTEDKAENNEYVEAEGGPINSENDSSIGRNGRRKKQISGQMADSDFKVENEMAETKTSSEPEKRSLRATNSRRSREALVRHMMMGSVGTKTLPKEKPKKANDVKDCDKDAKKCDDEQAKKEENAQSTNTDSGESAVTGDSITVKKVQLSSLLDGEGKNNTRSDSKSPSADDDAVERRVDETKELSTPNDGAKANEDEMVSMDTSDPSGSSNSAVRSSRNRQRTNSRSGIDFRVGGRLEACDFMSNWYASKIVDVDWKEREVLIHFEGWSSRFDEWVAMDSYRLRAITRTSARKEHKQKLQEDFKVGENVLAKWADGQMYPARVEAVNSKGSYQVVFLDDGIQKTVKPGNLCRASKEEFAFHLSQTKSASKKNKPADSSNRSKRRLTISSDDEASEHKISKKDGDNEFARSKKLTKSTKNEKGANSAGGLNMRRKKLLIGGIFQAKRTFHDNPSTMKKRTANRDDGTSSKRSANPPRFDPKIIKRRRTISEDRENKLLEEAILASKSNVVESESTIDDANLKKGGFGVAPKEFVIEEDHNHFKCPMENCGKSFRKESLLASHMKHYHDHGAKEGFVRKKDSAGCSKKQESTSVVKPTPRDVSVESKNSETSEVNSRVVCKKRRGFRHCVAKHKVNMAKRRPLLMYRRKTHEDQKLQEKVNTSPASTTATAIENESESVDMNDDTNKRRTFRRRKEKSVSSTTETQVKKEEVCVQVDKSVNDGTEVSVNEQKPAIETTSPVFRKAGRKRKWRCNARVTKRVVDGESNELSKMGAAGSPDVAAKPENDDGGREEVVNCICRVLEEDGLMMQCETCMAWQHGVCFNIEEEDKVPNKYVCFACRDPSGQRESYRYWYDQDWWKSGEMASLNFVSPPVDRYLCNSVLKAHALNGNMLSIKKFLHSLQNKLQCARSSDCLNTSMWNKSWLVDSCSPLDSVLTSRLSNADGTKQPSMYLDHSYSAPNVNGGETEQPQQNSEEKMNGIKEEIPVANEVPIIKENDKQWSFESESQVHLLDHLEQMQDEVDHRLDEISQHIEALEAEWEENSPCASLGDFPSIKSTLKILQSNLDKMQRMSTFQ